MGIDEDPYFRLVRDNAHRMRYPSPKPALIPHCSTGSWWQNFVVEPELGRLYDWYAKTNKGTVPAILRKINWPLTLTNRQRLINMRSAAARPQSRIIAVLEEIPRLMFHTSIWHTSKRTMRFLKRSTQTIKTALFLPGNSKAGYRHPAEVCAGVPGPEKTRHRWGFGTIYNTTKVAVGRES